MADTKPPDDAERLKAFASLVRRMREAQQRYFRTKKLQVLQEAKDLERYVDEAVADVLGEKTAQSSLWDKM